MKGKVPLSIDQRIACTVNGLGGEDYRAARARHAAARAEAYAGARYEAIAHLGIPEELRITDIDERALDAWRERWSTRPHPGGFGGWNWPLIVERRPRRAAILPMAIWYGEDLCGLAIGYATRHRTSGARHTVVLTHAERRPEPPAVPLRGSVILLVVAVARSYGDLVGGTRIRLANPDRRLLGYYTRLGFDVVARGDQVLYCERRIT